MSPGKLVKIQQMNETFSQGVVSLTRQCFKCQTVFNINLTIEEYERWIGGMLIQEAMPNLSAEIRELLISGTCPECWKMLMESNEEELMGRDEPYDKSRNQI